MVSWSKDPASYHTSLCGLTQESSKGDDRRHAGAVEEEEGGQTLKADGIRVVRKVVRSLSLDVQDEPTKYPMVKQGFNQRITNYSLRIYLLILFNKIHKKEETY